MPVPQVVNPAWSRTGRCCRRSSTCPARTSSRPAALKLPGTPNRDFAVGEFARNFGAQVPTRLVSPPPSRGCATPASTAGPRSCRGRPPRTAARSRRSRRAPATSSTSPRRGTRQVAKDVAGHRLEQQDIILTVPASFDAAARELTVEAARAAGLENVTLLEEPQAAFYAWLDASGDDWREQVEGRRPGPRLRRRRRHDRLHADRRRRGGRRPGADAPGRRRPHPARRRQHGPGAGPRRRPRRSRPRGIKLDAGQMQQLAHGCRARQGDAPRQTPRSSRPRSRSSAAAAR